MKEKEDKTVLHIQDRADSIEVNKTNRGYTWSIKVYHNQDEDVVVEKIDKINKKLTKQFGVETNV